MKSLVDFFAVKYFHLFMPLKGILNEESEFCSVSHKVRQAVRKAWGRLQVHLAK